MNARRTTRDRTRRALRVIVALASLALAASTGAQERTGSESRRPTLIVKYASTGPQALDRCAEEISRSGRPFASATRDASRSLDMLAERFGLRRHRAVMGARAGESLEARRARLKTRFERLRRRSARGTQSLRRPGDARRARAPTPDLAHVYTVELTTDDDPERVAALLAADPHVEWAQPNHTVELDQALPFDDPFLASAGSWGQSFADLWAIERLDLDEAWARSTGEGVVVAVVDSGVDPEHPDLADNLWVNPGEDLDGDGRATALDRNGRDDDGNGFVDDLIGFDFANSVDVDEDGLYDGPDDVSDADPFDDRGHGSHVAGTIAAVANDGFGIVGVAPGARIMAVKGFRASGPGDDALLWRGVLYAAENGARVINTSWSCGPPCPNNPFADEVLALVESLGSVVVTSAGNASTDVVIQSPENGDQVITVGSIGVNDQLSGFSNHGWLLDVVAPGGGPSGTQGILSGRRNILSVLSSGANDDTRLFAVGDDHFRSSGTSMAAPHVAGAIALLLGERPGLTAREIRRIVRSSAEDLGAPGADPKFGAGLIDPPAALRTQPTNADLRIIAPRTGTTLDPLGGPVELEGLVEGTDLSRAWIEIAAGLTPSRFSPIESVGDSRVSAELARGASPPVDEDRAAILGSLDVTALETGPHVLRLIGELDDGRTIEERVVFAVERNHFDTVSGDRAPVVRTPVLAANHVVWRQGSSLAEDAPEAPALWLNRFPFPWPSEADARPIPSALFESTGVPRFFRASGHDLVWVVEEDTDRRLERCRVEPGPEPRCDVRVVVRGEATPSRVWLGGHLLIWTRVLDGDAEIVGCRLGAPDEPCRPTAILADSAGEGWQAQSFDGATLLVKRGNDFARCAVHRFPEGCEPEPIRFRTPIPGIPSDFVHQGRLHAFSNAGTRILFPPGCDPDSGTADCVPSVAFAIEHHACWLEETTRECDAISISDVRRFEQAEGLTVSGRRIVWSMASDTSPSAIEFCEFDPIRDLCPRQRLTGQPMEAVAPILEGNRLVWQDARKGADTVLAFTFPSLAVPGRIRVRAGERLSLPAFAFAGSGGALRFDLEGPAASPLEVGWDPMWPGAPLGFLEVAVPVSTPVGTGDWLLRATERGGIHTTSPIRAEVTAPAPTPNPEIRSGKTR